MTEPIRYGKMQASFEITLCCSVETLENQYEVRASDYINSLDKKLAEISSYIIKKLRGKVEYYITKKEYLPNVSLVAWRSDSGLAGVYYYVSWEELDTIVDVELMASKIVSTILKSIKNRHV